MKGVGKVGKSRCEIKAVCYVTNWIPVFCHLFLLPLLNKIYDVLFFRGKEEIIGREIREFMENNKALEKELIEETGVSQTEITKYLQESVHLKEDKRTKLFRWYLEKKLSRMESGTTSFPWSKY